MSNGLEHAKGEQTELPGFAEFVGKVVTDRAGAEDLGDESKYTAEVVMRDYPGTYASAVRALFYYRLPVRTVSDLFRMSRATVAAIRNHVLAASANGGAASFFVEARMRSQRDIVACQLMDLLEDRLSNHDQTKKLTMGDIVGMLKQVDSIQPPSNGTKNDKPPIIPVVEPDQFDAVLDGLEDEKKCAET